MSRDTNRRAARLSSRALPYVVLLVSLLLTLAATLAFASNARVADELRFEREVQQVQGSIAARLETYVSLLRSTAGLFAASDQVTRAEFHAYAQRLELRERYPGLQGIGFSRRLSAAEVAALEAEMRAAGVPEFAVWPDAPRAEYHAIVYLEPLDRRNQAAIGYDMFSDATRRAAMELARDSGQPAASGRVTLVQEIDADKQAGFLIYVPVYRGGETPGSLAERRERLLGFVYSPFRAGDLIESSALPDDEQLVDFQIYDGAALPANLLYQTHHEPEERPSFETSAQLEVASRRWTIAYHTHPAFRQTQTSVLVPFLGLAGFLISLLLFVLVHAQARARERAEAAVRSRDEFFSVASHELKTPLTTLLGNAQLLQRRAAREGTLSARDQRSLLAISDQAQRLSRLVSALLDHSRIQAGRLVIDRQRLDLAELVRRVVDETTSSLTSHTLTLRAPDGQVAVEGDELRLTQVLQNLLSNAVKYSPEGGPVDVSLAAVAGVAELTVSDRGVGIPESALPRLFEPFYRAPNAGASAAGMGIGLFVVREIVIQHGGTVAVQSDVGRGSRFTVRLPLASVAAAAPGCPTAPSSSPR